MNEVDEILDDLLARYHAWARSFRANHLPSSDPVFRHAKSGKGWDSTADVIEDELTGSTMQAVDFHVSEMKDPHRTAVYILARNCYTGRNVWLSPRLPADPLERGIVVTEARNEITRRLMRAGVM